VFFKNRNGGHPEKQLPKLVLQRPPHQPDSEQRKERNNFRRESDSDLSSHQQIGKTKETGNLGGRR
jgi:hypothetical protein